jgi:anti-anti-sigma factor
MNLEIRERQYQGIPIVEVMGKVLDQEVFTLAKRLEFLYQQEHKKIVLDLTNTTYLDSHGLGIIVYYHSMMKEAGRQFIVLNASKDADAYVKKLFTLTKLESVLTIVNSEENL